MRPAPETSDHHHVDPKIWKASAGASIQIPTVDSRVYYFPQGHMEQSCPNYPLYVVSGLGFSSSLIPCVITAVHFLADPITDEVFAKLVLLPVASSKSNSGLDLPSNGERQRGGDDENDGDRIASFAKILTPSDANNGGGFSVPRFCADSVFPPLDYQSDPPVQTLSVTDIHGEVWDFRHIYRGTPRRHLLTTGWSKFVNSKKLIAGDSVVFMKNFSGKMFVGVRRNVRSGHGGNYGLSDTARWRLPSGVGGKEKVEEGGEVEGFWLSGRGRLTPEAVAEAMRRAAEGQAFEVVYYPRLGWSDFVVKAEVVDAALKVTWGAGMRVKMALETEDSARTTWYQGTVDSAMVPDSGPFRRSPWRMLEVTWDEPEMLPNLKKVSPWQVEFVSPTPVYHSATFTQAKKFKYYNDPAFISQEDGEIFYSATGTSSSTAKSLSSYYTFPAGMQGARQAHLSSFSVTNYTGENPPLTNIYGNNITTNLRRVNTDLNIGSSQSENLSPESQSSAYSFGTDPIGNKECNPTRLGSNSFQLFGKTIYKEPTESGCDDSSGVESDNSKEYGVEKRINNALDLPSTYPLIDQLNKYQSVSAAK